MLKAMASRTLHYEIRITDPLRCVGETVQVFPCRCGETHSGDYALYDYGQHNCFHDEPLVRLDQALPDLMCLSCGKTFPVVSDQGD